MPDAAPWRAIADRRERLRSGLVAIYKWYQRNAELTGCMLRDIEVHPLTREVSELRTGATIAAYHEVLGAGLSDRQRAMLGLALGFHTWRSLVREGGLNTTEAVEAMVDAVCCTA